MEEKIVSVDAVHSAGKQMCEELRAFIKGKEDFTNIVIYAIPRGGLITAQYTAYSLGKALLPVKPIRIFEDSQSLVDYLTPLKGRTLIIFCDDIKDSGATIKRMGGIAEKCKALKEETSFVFASLFHRKSTPKNYEYPLTYIYGEELGKPGERPYFVFPWERV